MYLLLIIIIIIILYLYIFIFFILFFLLFSVALHCTFLKFLFLHSYTCVAFVSGHWNAESVGKKIIELNYYLPYYFAFVKKAVHN